jgi:hypothetical protein
MLLLRCSIERGRQLWWSIGCIHGRGRTLLEFEGFGVFFGLGALTRIIRIPVTEFLAHKKPQA